MASVLINGSMQSVPPPMIIGSNHVRRMLTLAGRDLIAPPEEESLGGAAGKGGTSGMAQFDASASGGLLTASSSSSSSASLASPFSQHDEEAEDGGRKEASAPFNLLASLPEDVLALIIQKTGENAKQQLRALHALSRVSLSLHSLLHEHLSDELAIEAAAELVAQGFDPKHAADGRALETPPTLLNLSSSSLGRLECELLSIALRRGIIPPHVTTLWLQNNHIDARGLRWLARGLRSMPDDSGLSSISLGENAFHARLDDVPRPLGLERALAKVAQAASERQVRLRLKS